MKRGLLLLLFASLAGVVPVQARLGETLKEISERNGKPQPQARKTKNAAVWLIEGDDGQLVYTATFDASGRSIAEGIKPVRNAKFSKETVQSFMRVQLAPYRDSTTLRTAKPGEPYVFGGRTFTASMEETIIVDVVNDFMIVWNQGATPSVLIVRSVML